jgi:hypothetical protein
LQQAGFEVVCLEARRVSAALVDVCSRYTTIQRGKGHVLAPECRAGSRVRTQSLLRRVNRLERRGEFSSQGFRGHDGADESDWLKDRPL